MTSINNLETPDINRGVELILRRRQPVKKTFSYGFDKMVSFLRRDFTISFHFSLDIRNQK
jgi:hypothetical protein